ncbi:hypothetical protein [Desulfobacula sp.]
MAQMDPKVKQWIDEKKDPRSAFWQAGIEAVLNLFSQDLEKGRLTPVHPLEEKDLPIFKAALERVDLSPNLLAAFLPPPVANAIIPPDSAKELLRIEKGKPSYKIIILRPGKEERIICAEISEHAHRPGLDIFQSGALLGSFDYVSHDACISELTKALRAHAWEKDKWQRKEYLAYTLNWFKKTITLGKADVSVDKNHSFFHSPTLIRTNRIDALFLLIYEVLHHRLKNTASLKQDAHTLVETDVLGLLNLVRTLDLLDFTAFTDAENKMFKNEFARTVQKLVAEMNAL